jgi:hypothetical protein
MYPSNNSIVTPKGSTAGGVTECDKENKENQAPSGFSTNMMNKTKKLRSTTNYVPASKTSAKILGSVNSSSGAL